MARYVVQCICEICCCGRHKCPHRPKVTVPWGPCIISEYSAQYNPHCIDPVLPIVPPVSILASNDPLSCQTTNRTDYIPHAPEKVFVHHADAYKPPQGKMDGTTLYKSEYTPKYCPPSHPIKPTQGRMCPEKFNGQPTYRSDYRQWELPPIEKQKNQTSRSPLPKFDGEPLYRREYTAKCIPPSINYKPKIVPRISEPFTGDTIYRTEYTPHQIKMVAPSKPVVYEKNRVPLESLTTNRSDFTPKAFCPNPPIKPPATIQGASAPMSKITTNRNDYQKWGSVPPEKPHVPVYETPRGERYFDSTYKDEFTQKPICRTLTVKPPESTRCEAKFDGTTNYRNDYIPWSVEPLAASKKTEWAPSTMRFQGDTTNRTDFVHHPCVVVPEPYKPQQRALDNGPFDDRTLYRSEYTPKEFCKCCPAGFLSTDVVSRDGYAFDHYDERGHQQYRNTGSPNPQQKPTVSVS